MFTSGGISGFNHRFRRRTPAVIAVTVKLAVLLRGSAFMLTVERGRRREPLPLQSGHRHFYDEPYRNRRCRNRARQMFSASLASRTTLTPRQQLALASKVMFGSPGPAHRCSALQRRLLAEPPGGRAFLFRFAGFLYPRCAFTRATSLTRRYRYGCLHLGNRIQNAICCAVLQYLCQFHFYQHFARHVAEFAGF